MDMFDTDSDEELPTGWEERVTLDGKVYYANHNLECTQWIHPNTGKRKVIAGELPFGWEMKVGDGNSVIYIDHINKKTTYTDPRLAFAVEETASDSSFIRQVKQRFDASSTPAQILLGRDLTSKHVIVTGANSGIGFETALALSCQGARVVLACRDVLQANQAIERIKIRRPQAQVEAFHIDLLCLKTVQDFAERYKLTGRPLHMLILNAGVMGGAYSLSDDGYESTFQTNHLGHFYLTRLLQPVLERSAPARVIVVSAESHRFTDLNSDNISAEKLSPPEIDYRAILAYNQSKLCNVLFALELNRRLSGQRVHANAVHPGNVVCTGITRHWWFYRLLYTLVRPFAKSKEQASATSVYCAVVRDLEGIGGYYFNHCCRCEPLAEAKSASMAVKLWDISESMLMKAKTLQS